MSRLLLRLLLYSDRLRTQRRSHPPLSLYLEFCQGREEHSMNRYQHRPELLERFEGHWSMRIFQGKSVLTNPLVPCFQGKSDWTNGPERLSKVCPEWYWSMGGFSQQGHEFRRFFGPQHYVHRSLTFIWSQDPLSTVLNLFQPVRGCRSISIEGHAAYGRLTGSITYTGCCPEIGTCKFFAKKRLP